MKTFALLKKGYKEVFEVTGRNSIKMSVNRSTKKYLYNLLIINTHSLSKWSRQESNLCLKFRKLLFYPLNYGTFSKLTAVAELNLEYKSNKQPNSFQH